MWLGWQPAVVLAVVVGALGLSLRSARGRAATAGAVAREAALVLTLYAVWRVVMSFRSTKLDEGLDHGRAVWHVERALHIGTEASIERWFLAHPTFVQAANAFYATVHVPALIAFLVWLFVRHRDRYPALRNTLAAITAVSLFLHWFPVAPPRMYPDLGFVDAARAYGQSVYGPVGQGISNQVSALPSLHAAWALLVAYGVIVASPSPRRWWIASHPALTILVIVATANHWWLDSVAAAAILAVVLGLQWAFAQARARRAAGLDLTPVGTDEDLEPAPAGAPA
jgi:hypothetical protein